jgi:hypothetical protein
VQLLRIAAIIKVLHCSRLLTGINRELRCCLDFDSGETLSPRHVKNRGWVVENRRTMNVIRNLRCWLRADSNHYRMSCQSKDEADVQVKGSLMEDVHIHTHI